jgi:glutamate 5-kinase
VGLTNYSAREISRIKGRQSQEIAQTLGGPKGYDEVIHRDNLVIFPET